MLKTFIVLAIILIMVLLVSETLLGQFSSLHFIGSKGNVKFLGVEAYWDQGLTNRTESINWGSVLAGSSQNVTLYIRSISTIETTLELRTANWTLRNSTDGFAAGPSENSPYMNLTWNYNGTTVHPSEIIQVTLTLSTSSSPDFVSVIIANDVKGFDFDIVISVNG